MKDQIFGKKSRLIAGGILTLFMLLTLIAPVFAEGEGDELPPDPGVGTVQDETKSNTLVWITPYGSLYYIDDAGGDILLDWQYVDPNSSTAEGVIPLTGTGGTEEEAICGAGGGFSACFETDLIVPYLLPSDLTAVMLGLPEDTGAVGYEDDCSRAGNDCEKIDGGYPDGGVFTPGNNANVVVIKAGVNEYYYIPLWMKCDEATMGYCVTWNGDGSIEVVRIGDASIWREISNIQFWHTDFDLSPVPDPDSSGHCPDVRIAPGVITVSAEQIAPNHAVVVGQDLGENGVTIEYHISIDPTLVLYQKWEILDREVIACVEGKNNDPAYVAECGETNCGCPKNWHAVIEDIWGCRDYLKVYPEELDELSPGASLKLDSRAWIQGELAAAYPGAHLLNPDWSFGSEAECEWANNTCNLEFTLTIPVTDPGWYDIKLEGMTTGTLASPGRSFEITAGEFGVYMIDSSIR